MSMDIFALKDYWRSRAAEEGKRAERAEAALSNARDALHQLIGESAEIEKERDGLFARVEELEDQNRVLKSDLAHQDSVVGGYRERAEKAERELASWNEHGTDWQSLFSRIEELEANVSEYEAHPKLLNLGELKAMTVYVPISEEQAEHNGRFFELFEMDQERREETKLRIFEDRGGYRWYEVSPNEFLIATSWERAHWRKERGDEGFGLGDIGLPEHLTEVTGG